MTKRHVTGHSSETVVVEKAHEARAALHDETSDTGQAVIVTAWRRRRLDRRRAQTSETQREQKHNRESKSAVAQDSDLSIHLKRQTSHP